VGGLSVAKKIVGVLFVVLVLVGAGVALRWRVDSREEARAGEVAQVKEDRFAQAVAETDAFMAAGRWEEARARLVEASKLRPGDPGLIEKGAKIDAELARAEEEKRRATVAEGLVLVEEVVGSREKCRTASWVSSAWSRLRQAVPGDPEIEKVRGLAGKLEKCRGESRKALEDYYADYYAKRREERADLMETTFLREGMDVRAKVGGKNKDLLTLTWVLFGRATVFRMVDGTDFLETLEFLGFKKVTFSTGFGEYYYYELEPGDLAASAAGAEMVRLLISNPIRL
jgi:hypothetical protein